jgi:hypothetical protein
MPSRLQALQVVVLIGTISVCTARAQSDSPRAALDTYLRGIKNGDVRLVKSVYYFGERRPDFYLPGPQPLEEYRVLKETVLDSAAVQQWNAKGIIPAAMIGDVQLDVDERIAGHSHKFSYSLRRIDGQWRIYAHSAWDAPD